MDNKQIEIATKLLTEMKDEWKGITVWEYKHEIETLLSLAQLFLSVKGAPKKNGYAKGLVEEIGILCMGKTSEEMHEGFKEYKNLKEIEKERNIGYNLCHDEFTAWLAGRMEGIKGYLRAIREKDGQDPFIRYQEVMCSKGYLLEIIATAVKTMILEGK